MIDIPHPRITTRFMGHESAEHTLLNAAQSGRLHHGWLITGMAGIGKTTLAFRFARALLAGLKPEAASLQIEATHPIAKRIASGGHGDILLIERSFNKQGVLRQEIVVDDVRRIEGFFHFTAAEGGWRIVIIDEADRMNTESQNAVLKLLEEPPPQCLLLLTAQATGRLLPTIRSRVRTLALAPLPEPVMAALLAEFLPDESAETRAALAALAEGSIGHALRLAQIDGLTLYQEMFTILADLHTCSAKVLLDYAEKLARKGSEDSYSLMTDALVDWLSRTTRLAATGEMAERIDGEGAPALTLAQKVGAEQMLALWDKVRLLFAQADGLNLDHKQTILAALFAIKNAAA